MGKTLSALAVIFISISILIVLATLKIWMPDMIGDDAFVKLILTFGVFALGSVLIQLLQSASKSAKEDQKGK